jgi:Fcf2 pre-rRNA processing
MGTVVDSAADFYSGRVPKRERKKTLVDELMADANFQK